MGRNIIGWPSLQYCTMSAFGGDALQRKAMSHKSNFIIIDTNARIAEKVNTTMHGLQRLKVLQHIDYTKVYTIRIFYFYQVFSFK